MPGKLAYPCQDRRRRVLRPSKCLMATARLCCLRSCSQSIRCSPFPRGPWILRRARTAWAQHRAVGVVPVVPGRASPLLVPLRCGRTRPPSVHLIGTRRVKCLRKRKIKPRGLGGQDSCGRALKPPHVSALSHPQGRPPRVVLARKGRGCSGRPQRMPWPERAQDHKALPGPPPAPHWAVPKAT